MSAYEPASGPCSRIGVCSAVWRTQGCSRVRSAGPCTALQSYARFGSHTHGYAAICGGMQIYAVGCGYMQWDAEICGILSLHIRICTFSALSGRHFHPHGSSPLTRCCRLLGVVPLAAIAAPITSTLPSLAPNSCGLCPLTRPSPFASPRLSQPSARLCATPHY